MQDMEMAPELKWLTVAEVAAILDVTPETVRQKIKAGEFPAVRRASNAPHAAFLIDAAEWERQRARDVELAAARKRLGGRGVVTGYDAAEVVEQVREIHGPETADSLRATINRHELFERLQAEMADDPEFQRRLEELDEDERIEHAAQELAARARIADRVRKRAQEILDEDDD
jgi:hypothetical protein